MKVLHSASPLKTGVGASLGCAWVRMQCRPAVQAWDPTVGWGRGG